MSRWVLVVAAAACGPAIPGPVDNSPSCAIARHALVAGDAVLADGRLIDALDLATDADRACGVGAGEALRDRALAGLGLDPETRRALHDVAAHRLDIEKLEAARRFGAELRARTAELDDALARAERGARAAGLGSDPDVPPATAKAWLAALLLADAGDAGVARARLAAIPPIERRAGIDITLAMLADTPADAQRAMSRVVFPAEHAAELVPGHRTVPTTRRDSAIVSDDRTLTAQFGDGVEIIRIATFEPVGGFATPAPVVAAAFGRRALVLAIADADGNIELRDVATLQLLAHFAVGPDVPPIAYLALGDHWLVAAADNAPLVVIDLDTGTVRRAGNAAPVAPPVVVGDTIVFATATGIDGLALDGAVRWTVPGKHARLAESGRVGVRELGDSGQSEVFELEPRRGLVGRPVVVDITGVVYVDATSVIGRRGPAWVRVSRAGEVTKLGSSDLGEQVSIERTRRIATVQAVGQDARILDLRDLHVLASALLASPEARYLAGALFANGRRWSSAGTGSAVPCHQPLADAVEIGDRVAVRTENGYTVLDARCQPARALELRNDERIFAAWPDGRTIAVTTARGLAIVDTDSGQREEVAEHVDAGGVTRDGHLVAGNWSHVVVIARDGTVVGTAKTEGTVHADPLGVGTWIVDYKRLRHRPDPLRDEVDLDLRTPGSPDKLLAAASMRRFAAIDDSAIAVVGAGDDHATSITRPGAQQVGLSPDGTTLAIPESDEVTELVDVASGATVSWLVTRGRDRWLRIDGDRVAGSPLAVGESSSLVWRTGARELPGWLVSPLHAGRGREP